MAPRFDTRLVSIMVSQATAPQERSKVLATAAKAGVAELISTGAAPPQFTRYVDGVMDAPEEAVRPDGAITYRFGLLGEIVAFAVQELKRRSPVRLGRFRDSFMVSVDGRPIAAGSLNPASVPEGAEIFVYNLQPYARKVDVQLVGGRPLKFSVPAGLFDNAAKAVAARFGNTVTARRLYSLKFPGQAATRAGRSIEYPALVIARR